KMTLKWQVRPSFDVVQGESSRDALEDLIQFFGCGKIYRNRRRDNHREDLLRYNVYRFQDLRTKIVPFFQENPLRTSKRTNFEKFVRIVELMELRPAPVGAGDHRDRGDPTDDEPPEAVRGLENPQRPYAGPLRGSAS